MPFPATAKLLADPFNQTVGGAVERTEMEDGNAKQGRARAFDAEQFDVTYLMTQAELEAFRAFHRDELQRGALRWLWTDPVLQTTESVRIVGGGYRSVPHQRFRQCYRVSFKLEIYR